MFPSLHFMSEHSHLFSTFCRIALKKILHKNKHNLYIFVSTSVDFSQICRKEKIYIFGSCNITVNLFKSWESINCTKTQIYLTLLFHSENFHSTIICPHTYSLRVGQWTIPCGWCYSTHNLSRHKTKR